MPKLYGTHNPYIDLEGFVRAIFLDDNQTFLVQELDDKNTVTFREFDINPIFINTDFDVLTKEDDFENKPCYAYQTKDGNVWAGSYDYMKDILSVNVVSDCDEISRKDVKDFIGATQDICQSSNDNISLKKYTPSAYKR